MDGLDSFIVTLLAVAVAVIATLAVILIPVEIKKQNALTNLYNAAAEGKASGVIIQIGGKE